MSPLVEAAERLRAGELVLFPTETLFGIAAHPGHEGAVNALLALKSRGAEQGIPLILGSPASLEQFEPQEPEEVRSARRSLCARFWPGPLTLVMTFGSRCFAPGIYGPEGSVAVRLSSHPLAAQLAHQAGGAITATSANPHGLSPAKSAEEARAYFPELFLLHGNAEQPTHPSTILDVRKLPFTLLREGAIPAAQLTQYCDIG